MHLISRFNSLTTFNYSPHFIITTNRHMWGTFEYILSDTQRPILSECKLRTVQLQSVAAGVRTLQTRNCCQAEYLPKKEPGTKVSGRWRLLGILYIISRNFSFASHFRRKKIPHISLIHETAIRTANISLL